MKLRHFKEGMIRVKVENSEMTNLWWINIFIKYLLHNLNWGDLREKEGQLPYPWKIYSPNDEKTYMKPEYKKVIKFNYWSFFFSLHTPYSSHQYAVSSKIRSKDEHSSLPPLLLHQSLLDQTNTKASYMISYHLILSFFNIDTYFYHQLK